MLHVVYRAAGGENAKPRPPFYDRVASLGSCLRALERCGDADVLYLNDGDIPPNLLALMRESGEVVQLPPLPAEARGTKVAILRSYTEGVREAVARFADDDLVYFAEDDYLFTADAFACLQRAAETLPHVAYFSFIGTLWPIARGHWVDGDLWQEAEATTLSFAARVGTLRRDLRIHRLGMRVGDDTDMFRALHGLRPYRWPTVIGEVVRADPAGARSFASRARGGVGRALLNLLALRSAFHPATLVRPYRPLATHVELPPFLTEGEDWQAVADEASEWLAARPVQTAPAGERV